VARGDRGGEGLEADEEVLALDRPDVGVALGGEGVHAVGEDLEGLLLDGGVGGGGEGLDHGVVLSANKRFNYLWTVEPRGHERQSEAVADPTFGPRGARQ